MVSRPRPAFRPRRRAFRLGLVLALAAVVLHRLWQLDDVRAPVELEPGAVAIVERVIDGDTFVLEGGERVRLLGVDTPETKHPHRPVEPFGPEAADYTRRHVEGQAVRLEFDRERRDRYRRILAYVYVGDWFLNEELIRAGLSRAELRFPYRDAMKRRFRTAEREARLRRAGIWSEVAPRTAP